MTALQDRSWVELIAVAVGLVGIGFWIVSWFAIKDVWRKRRFSDFGGVLIFGGMLTRYAARGGPANGIEWMLCGLAALFLAAALWSLIKTQDGGPK